MPGLENKITTWTINRLRMKHDSHPDPEHPTSTLVARMLALLEQHDVVYVDEAGACTSMTLEDLNHAAPGQEFTEIVFRQDQPGATAGSSQKRAVVQNEVVRELREYII